MTKQQSPARHIRAAALILGALALSAPLAVPAQAAAPVRPADTLPGQITMAGGTLMRDGQPWELKGVKFVGRITPESDLAFSTIGQNIRLAHTRWGPQLPAQVKAFGANTVSIAISQPGLNPQNPVFLPAYRQQVVDAVGMFRKAGFTVILAMNWERAAGSRTEPGFPSQNTINAWNWLLQALPANDAGLIFDVFNEPSTPPSPEVWQQWQQWHEAIIAAIRNAGFHRQVLIVSGLRGGEILEGSPPIHDPDNRVVFGIHPQLSVKKYNFDTREGWDAGFGNFCTQHTCLATEWTLARRPEGDKTGCGGDAPRLAMDLLRYLRARRMGIVGWSFDYPGTLFQADKPDVPTNFDTWAGSCEASQQPYGNGQMLFDWFHGRG